MKFFVKNGSLMLSNNLDFTTLIEQFGFVPKKDNLLCFPKHLPTFVYHCDTRMFDIKGNLLLLPKKCKQLLLELLKKNIIVEVQKFE